MEIEVCDVRVVGARRLRSAVPSLTWRSLAEKPRVLTAGQVLNDQFKLGRECMLARAHTYLACAPGSMLYRTVGDPQPGQ